MDTSGYKWVQGRPSKIQKKVRADSMRPETWTQLSKKQTHREIAEWVEESAKLQAARRNRETCEVSTDDKDYFKVIADAILKLEQILLLLCHAVEGKTADGSLQLAIPSLMPTQGSQIQKTKERGKVPKHVDHIPEKGSVGIVPSGPVHQPTSIQEAVQIPQAKDAVDKE